MDPNVTSLIASEGPALVTIPNVEIVSTGTYKLASGEHTFTKTELKAAVEAQKDPATRAPRLKIGHESLDVLGASGEPSFGKAINLRLSPDEETIIGDYVGVPKWLAGILPTAYPSRSIEADVMAETATGQTHDLLIKAVALLGVVAPGVSTLEDLEPLYGEELPEGVVVASEESIVAQVGDPNDSINAAVEDEDVRRAFYTQLDESQTFWWVRTIEMDPHALIVDTDGGGLVRVPFDINGDEVEFGEAVEVEVVYVEKSAETVNAARSAASSGRTIAVFASREQSRPETNDQEVDVKLTDEQKQRLGLSADASEEEQQEALNRFLASNNGGDDEGDEGGEGDGEKVTETEKTETEKETVVEPGSRKEEPVAASAGLVPTDPEALKSLQADAAAGRAAREAQIKASRDADLDSAIGDGKIPKSRRDHYEKLHKTDPEGTKQLLASLPKNMVPVEETGSGGESLAAAGGDAYPDEWLSPAERARRDAAKNGAGTPA